ncbi:MAG: filamentous hemagglutinin N-terminal domain-containing protein, partial [Candidatus Omnitrophica bacterium]|nr:filamentous hemagglutinin N-terminal domain-containing protein [Candidatus Omnitrophota bacterium]
MNFEKIFVYSFIILILLGTPSLIFALPEGEEVISGQANFERLDSTLNIYTPSEKLIVNYESFSIAQSEVVNFHQPSSSSIALNRVVGVLPSEIFGKLAANGRIFIVNPNGVLFGPNSSVDVPALVVSTLDISNEDFLNGNYKFFKSEKSSYVVNQGNIIIRNGGYVCLLSQAIENSGKIEAEFGTVVLASGEKMTLSLDDLNEISVVIDEPVKEKVLGFDSAIKNSGLISANGGKVILNAKLLNNVFDYAINNFGIIEAKSLVNNNGVVELVAEGAPINNIGKIEAEEVKVEVKDADFINEGKIIAEEVKVKVENGKVINKKDIIADGLETKVDGGTIIIEATTILQQGLISANAFEGGEAGEIVIISQTQTTLDTGSKTEAIALGLVGNGGKILINSLKGNTLVNALAVIDVSSGSISGNAGFIEVSAFEQLGFYGVLSGRA